MLQDDSIVKCNYMYDVEKVNQCSYLAISGAPKVCGINLSGPRCVSSVGVFNGGQISHEHWQYNSRSSIKDC